MAGICSRHQGYDPTCRLCNTIPTDPQRELEEHLDWLMEDMCDEYDDEQDHTRCSDCKGSGWYIGFTERKYCPKCDGSGYL